MTKLALPQNEYLENNRVVRFSGRRCVVRGLQPRTCVGEKYPI